MSLVEMLPSIESLSRVDKLRLIQFLAQNLAAGEPDLAIAGDRSYPVWSPDEAFVGAETLLDALRAEQGRAQ